MEATPINKPALFSSLQALLLRAEAARNKSPQSTPAWMIDELYGIEKMAEQIQADLLA